MFKLTLIIALAVLSLLLGCTTTESPQRPGAALDSAVASTTKVVLSSEVEWGALNPARGKKGPKAGTLWGDRTGPGPSGFLVEFLPGFESPPHIHNVSYRGVVLSGLLHNDDPDAEAMWMPTGSFWTQPRGGVHITAANGRHNLAYIEIEEGPYLVLPVEDKFHTEEVPVNVDESNIVWLGASNIVWLDHPGMPAASQGPKVAFLWGSPEEGKLNGTFVKIPAGFAGSMRSRGSSLRAVVIQGGLEHGTPGRPDTKTLDPGSCFSSQGSSAHQISNDRAEDCIIYVRTRGNFDLTAAPSEVQPAGDTAN